MNRPHIDVLAPPKAERRILPKVTYMALGAAAYVFAKAVVKSEPVQAGVSSFLRDPGVYGRD